LEKIYFSTDVTNKLRIDGMKGSELRTMDESMVIASLEYHII